MTPDSLFSMASTLVLPGWLLLALLPRWKPGTQVLVPVLIPALLALLYLVLILWAMPQAEGGFGSLQDVQSLFQDPRLLVAGWVHYLAFDLFIGAWIVRQAQRNGISHLWVLPCLAGTFLFGPAGWLLFLGIRFVHSIPTPLEA